MKTTMLFAAFTASLGLAGCGADGPTADEVGTALTQHVQHAVSGCPLLRYDDVDIDDQTTLDDDPEVHAVVTSYAVQSIFRGHDMAQARTQYQNTHSMPDWFPDDCMSLFETLNAGGAGSNGNALKMAQVFLKEFERAGIGSSFNSSSVQAAYMPFLKGEKTLHISKATLDLRQSGDRWRIVDQ